MTPSTPKSKALLAFEDRMRAIVAAARDAVDEALRDRDSRADHTRFANELRVTAHELDREALRLEGN